MLDAEQTTNSKKTLHHFIRSNFEGQMHSVDERSDSIIKVRKFDSKIFILNCEHFSTQYSHTKKTFLINGVMYVFSSYSLRCYY